jgi:hypothetical protein
MTQLNLSNRFLKLRFKQEIPAEDWSIIESFKGRDILNMIAFHLTEDQATVPVNQPKTYLILSYLFTNFKEKEYVFKFSDE